MATSSFISAQRIHFRQKWYTLLHTKIVGPTLGWLYVNEIYAHKKGFCKNWHTLSAASFVHNCVDPTLW